MSGSRPVVLSDRQGFDRRWFATNLEAVYVPTHPEQVADCVTSAITRYGRGVKVVSGRHCYENFVYNGATRCVIDMSAVNGLGFDPARNAFFVDAGCENWTVYRTLLNGFNKTLPAGSCYSVGAGGGCGNFGAIVRYYFAELPDAPGDATIWTLAWNWADLDRAKFGALLSAYTELVLEMPETDFTLLKLNHVSAAQIGLILQMVSPPGAGRQEHRERAEANVQRVKARFGEVAPSAPLVKPLVGHPGYMTTLPASDTAQHLTYLEAVQTLNGSGPNQFGKYKSAYMKKPFPERQVDAIYKWLRTTPSGLPPGDMSQSLLQVDSYGGALWLYFLDNFRSNPRNLVKVKQRWDPDDYFHHAQSIPV